MNYNFFLKFLFCLSLLSCNQSFNNEFKKINISLENRYQNSGFALVYNDNLKDIKKIETRSLDIYHKSLKKKSIVKITNPNNGKYLIANVKSNRIRFSNFYNSILSLRISEELELDFNEPFVELILLSK